MPCRTSSASAHTLIQSPASLRMGEHNDCAVIALAVASDLPYDDCHAFWELHGRQRGHGTYTYRTMPSAIEDFPELGFRATKVAGFAPSAGRSATLDSTSAWTARGASLRSFCRRFPSGRYLVCVARHALAIVDGVICDHDARTKDLRRVRNAWKIEAL